MLAPPRETAVWPVRVTTGTPIQRASQVVVPPAQGKGSRAHVDPMMKFEIVNRQHVANQFDAGWIDAAQPRIGREGYGDAPHFCNAVMRRELGS